ITAVDVTIFRPDRHVLLHEFAIRWLNTEHSLARCALMAGGTTRKRISRLNLGKLWVAAPSVAEQSRVAALLATVDEATDKTEAVIAKPPQVRAGLLPDLLTRGLDEHGQLRDPIAHPEQFKDSSLGRIPREWRVRTIEELATQVTDGEHQTPSRSPEGIYL